MQHVSSQLFGEKIPTDLFYTDHDCGSVNLIKHSEALTRKHFTDAEKLWIEFYAYVGLREDEIAKSLNDVRTSARIRHYVCANHDKILNLRVKYKNSIQKSPKYPYIIDTRAPYAPTTEVARSKGYLPEFGIDTGMDWEYLPGSGLSSTVLSEEAKNYLAYLVGALGGWKDSRVRNELFVYYALYTPETLLYLDQRVTEADIAKYVGGAMPAPKCPYVFSFEEYQQEWLSRSQHVIDDSFYGDDNQSLDMSTVGRACGGHISPEKLALSLAWQGLPAEGVSSLIHSCMDTTKASVNKGILLVRKALTQAISYDANEELLTGLPLTPSSETGGLFSRYPNYLYKPSFCFTGDDLKQYELYTWQTAIQRVTGDTSSLRDYYVWLQRTYGAQAAARYIALYSPYKGFSGLYKPTSRRDGWGGPLNPVAPPCPLPIPFEAVYNEKCGLIRYYEHLTVASGSVYRSEYTGEGAKVEPRKSPYADIDLSHATKEEAPSDKPAESELANDLADMVSTQRQEASESDTPAEESVPEVTPEVQVCEVPATEERVEEPEPTTVQSPAETPEQPAPNPEQEEPAESLTEPHSATPNEAIGEYELRPGVIQQVMFTDSNGTHVLKALPGDKKLAIDFALPGIDEHYDHGEASRRAEAVKETVRCGVFPPLATPPTNTPVPNADGITIGELAVKISSPVSKVIWNILNKNQENLKGSSISTVSRILNVPPVAMVQALADEHGWAESILSLSTLVGAQPAIILSVFSKNFNKDAPFTVLLDLFGVTEQEALHTLTSPKAGFDVRNIPVRRIAEALGKTYEAVIVESLNL